LLLSTFRRKRDIMAKIGRSAMGMVDWKVANSRYAACC
jgi:hypothetical protein